MAALHKSLRENQAQLVELQNAAAIRELNALQQMNGNEGPEPGYSPLHRPNDDAANAANAAAAREQNAAPEANAANQQQQLVDALRQMPDRDLVYSSDDTSDLEHPAEPEAAVQTTAPKPKPDEEELVDYDSD